MEDFYSSLSQSGLNMDEAARDRHASFSANQDLRANPVFGSQEHIDQLRRTQQTIAKTSFRRPRNAGSSSSRASSTTGAKFENLGKTSYKESHVSRKPGKDRTNNSSQAPKSTSSAQEKRNRKVVVGGQEATARPKRTRYRVFSDVSDGDSSDELNLTSSSQSIETPVKLSARSTGSMTCPPGSDSDDHECQHDINFSDGARLTTGSLSGKPKPLASKSSKSRLRDDEYGLSDETPEKKKPKIKPRAAHTRGRTKNNADFSGRGIDDGSSSETSSLYGQASGSTKPGSKPLRASSSEGPIRALLDEKGKEEETPRPKKPVRGKRVKDLAPFPMAKEGNVEDPDSLRDNHKTRPAPFPLSKDAELSDFTVQRNHRRSKQPADDADEDSADSGNDDDPLLMNSNDAILLRGGLAPFPMSSQDRPSNFRKILGSSNKTNVPRHESDDPKWESNGILDVPDISDLSFTQPDDRFDPKALCPYCDMPFPPNPSPLLLDMLKRIPKYPDARPTNPLGLKAPLLSYVSMCQRHQFEMQLLPTAQAAGWPTYIDFAAIPKRIRALRQHLMSVLREKEKSIFWRELREDIEKQGVKKTMGIANQFNSFEKCQPGYYGEQGEIVIFQTLSRLFAPDCIDANLLAPLTHRDFLRCVLVPECAVALIQEDFGRGTNLDYAIRTLRESSKYGAAMFPDLDNRDGTNLEERDSGGQRVGETLIQEQARMRRLELVEEERSAKVPGELKKQNMKLPKRSDSDRSAPRDSGDAEGMRRREGVSNLKEKTKHGKKGNVGVIELSDSSPVRARSSSQRYLRKTGETRESDLSDSYSKSRKSEISSKQQHHLISSPAAGSTTAKSRSQAEPTTRPKNGLLAMLMDSDAFSSDSDKETPRPPARICRDPYESDSGIVLPEEDNRYKNPARKKTTSSSSSLKINGSIQPLQAVKERKKRKEAVFQTTMWENDDESEVDESDGISSHFDTNLGVGSKREKESIARTNSHSWLWSDPSTPSTTPSN